MLVKIVLITDDNYALATATTIASIRKSKKGQSLYSVYVIGNNLSKENKYKILSLGCIGFYVSIIDANDKYKDLNYSHPYISKSLFYKFDIANLFKENEKVLYLDGDIIVNGDLTELYCTDLGDNYVGAVKDLLCYYKDHQHNFLNTESYFNAGMMLLNCKKIREKNLYPKFIEELTTHNYPNSDQDVFNVIFNQKIKYLSLKNNFINLYWGIDDFEDYRLNNALESKYSLSDFEIHSSEELNDYEKSSKNPLIIHYAGDKPWNLKKGKKFNVWRKYFKKSPYKHEKLKWQRGRKLFSAEHSEDRLKIRFFGIGFNFKVRSNYAK